MWNASDVQKHPSKTYNRRHENYIYIYGTVVATSCDLNAPRCTTTVPQVRLHGSRGGVFVGHRPPRDPGDPLQLIEVLHLFRWHTHTQTHTHNIYIYIDSSENKPFTCQDQLFSSKLLSPAMHLRMVQESSMLPTVIGNAWPISKVPGAGDDRDDSGRFVTRVARRIHPLGRVSWENFRRISPIAGWIMLNLYPVSDVRNLRRLLRIFNSTRTRPNMWFRQYQH